MDEVRSPRWAAYKSLLNWVVEAIEEWDVMLARGPLYYEGRPVASYVRIEMLRIEEAAEIKASSMKESALQASAEEK